MDLKNLRPSFVPAIVWFIISTILFCLPGRSFPKDDWLDKIWFDKWVHMGLFAVMVILWCWGFLGKKSFKNISRVFLSIAVLCFFYGLIIELVQRYLIPNRAFDGWDLLADAGGVALGYIFSRRYIKK